MRKVKRNLSQKVVTAATVMLCLVGGLQDAHAQKQLRIITNGDTKELAQLIEQMGKVDTRKLALQPIPLSEVKDLKDLAFEDKNVWFALLIDRSKGQFPDVLVKALKTKKGRTEEPVINLLNVEPSQVQVGAFWVTNTMEVPVLDKSGNPKLDKQNKPVMQTKEISRFVFLVSAPGEDSLSKWTRALFLQCYFLKPKWWEIESKGKLVNVTREIGGAKNNVASIKVITLIAGEEEQEAVKDWWVSLAGDFWTDFAQFKPEDLGREDVRRRLEASTYEVYLVVRHEKRGIPSALSERLPTRVEELDHRAVVSVRRPKPAGKGEVVLFTSPNLESLPGTLKVTQPPQKDKEAKVPDLGLVPETSKPQLLKCLGGHERECENVMSVAFIGFTKPPAEMAERIVTNIGNRISERLGTRFPIWQDRRDLRPILGDEAMRRIFGGDVGEEETAKLPKADALLIGDITAYDAKTDYVGEEPRCLNPPRAFEGGKPQEYTKWQGEVMSTTYRWERELKRRYSVFLRIDLKLVSLKPSELGRQITAWSWREPYEEMELYRKQEAQSRDVDAKEGAVCPECSGVQQAAGAKKEKDLGEQIGKKIIGILFGRDKSEEAGQAHAHPVRPLEDYWQPRAPAPENSVPDQQLDAAIEGIAERIRMRLEEVVVLPGRVEVPEKPKPPGKPKPPAPPKVGDLLALSENIAFVTIDGSQAKDALPGRVLAVFEGDEEEASVVAYLRVIRREDEHKRVRAEIVRKIGEPRQGMPARLTDLVAGKVGEVLAVSPEENRISVKWQPNPLSAPVEKGIILRLMTQEREIAHLLVSAVFAELGEAECLVLTPNSIGQIQKGQGVFELPKFEPKQGQVGEVVAALKERLWVHLAPGQEVKAGTKWVVMEGDDEIGEVEVAQPHEQFPECKADADVLARLKPGQVLLPPPPPWAMARILRAEQGVATLKLRPKAAVKANAVLRVLQDEQEIARLRVTEFDAERREAKAVMVPANTALQAGQFALRLPPFAQEQDDEVGRVAFVGQEGKLWILTAEGSGAQAGMRWYVFVEEGKAAEVDVVSVEETVIEAKLVKPDQSSSLKLEQLVIKPTKVKVEAEDGKEVEILGEVPAQTAPKSDAEKKKLLEAAIADALQKMAADILNKHGVMVVPESLRKIAQVPKLQDKGHGWNPQDKVYRARVKFKGDVEGPKVKREQKQDNGGEKNE